MWPNIFTRSILLVEQKGRKEEVPHVPQPASKMFVPEPVPIP